MYNDIFSNGLAMNDVKSFSGLRSDKDMFDLLHSQILDRQNKQKREERARKEEQVRKENEAKRNGLTMNKAESFSGSRSNKDMFDLHYLQTLSEQNRQEEEARKEEQARKEREAERESSSFFCMSFKNDVDRLSYMFSSDEEKEAIKHKQMEERGFIQKAEEVVETVKEVATRTVSGLRRRMNILKIMKEKKSYSYVTYNNGKVSENTLDVVFNVIKEISAMVINRIVLAADNDTFNRNMFPNTS